MDLADSEDSAIERSRTVEVCEIPAGTRTSTLTMMLESQRHTGVAGVRVDAVEFLTDDHSRALVTLCTAEGLFMSVYSL